MDQAEHQEEEKDTEGEQMDALVKVGKVLRAREKDVWKAERKLNRQQTSFAWQIEVYAVEKRCDKCKGIRGRGGLHCLSRDEGRQAYEASHLRSANYL
jgi:hypothetical protein